MNKKIIPKYVENIPEKLEEGILYISEKYETAIHLCGCGCKKEVVTPISKGEWNLIKNEKSVSLSPSIGSFQIPCQSHYWIRNNEIIFC